MTNKDGSFVVIFKSSNRREVFLVYRSDRPIWNLPGGGIEDGESPDEAATRETFEETGFEINITRKLGSYKNIDINTGGIWNTTYLYTGDIVSGEFTPEFSGCEGSWFDVCDLPTNIQSITTIRINDALANANTPFVKEFKPTP